MFSKALLAATYRGGKPGKHTEAHKRAEYHPFKTEYLFKNKIIPKDLYISRLIQHFLILKAIETRLLNLSETDKSEISAFFALSYLGEVWRTPAMDKDLQQLGVNSNEIQEGDIAQSTRAYLKKIENLKPKALLAHFLLHVAGFMHGGNIIQSKYIAPSNRLTSYTIPTNQYNFFSAASLLPSGKPTAMNLYQNMMRQVDTITLKDSEYEDILEQCNGIYEIMACIYNDLCAMHTHQPKLSGNACAVLSVSLIALALILKLLSDYCLQSDVAELFLDPANKG